ncbi:hypothetical protein C808_03233 [Lachnospiraceae bacterium M18-1]|nr:hypothetical protein C808_03233 [Lachnospiraceae bacterium M18-1]
MQAIVEPLFDAAYLISVISIGILMIRGFGFYIPVVLWADTVPMIGMLMIPKTCAYVWTVLIGYFAMKQV